MGRGGGGAAGRTVKTKIIHNSVRRPAQRTPAPKTCTVTQTYKSGGPAVSGGGEGQGVVLLGVPRNENLES